MEAVFVLSATEPRQKASKQGDRTVVARTFQTLSLCCEPLKDGYRHAKKARTKYCCEVPHGFLLLQTVHLKSWSNNVSNMMFSCSFNKTEQGGTKARGAKEEVRKGGGAKWKIQPVWKQRRHKPISLQTQPCLHMYITTEPHCDPSQLNVYSSFPTFPRSANLSSTFTPTLDTNPFPSKYNHVYTPSCNFN